MKQQKHKANHPPDRSVRETLQRLRAENLRQMKQQVKETSGLLPELLNIEAWVSHHPKTVVLSAAALGTATSFGVARAFAWGRGRRRPRRGVGFAGGALRLTQLALTVLPHIFGATRMQGAAQSSAEMVEREVFLGHA